MNFHYNSKNKKRKIDLVSDSALCASFMKIGVKMMGGGGSTYPYLGQGPNICIL